MSKQRLSLLCLLLCWLAGCSHWYKTDQLTPTQPNITDQPHPLHDQTWALQGKLGVNVGGKRNSVFIDWKQQGPSVNLILNGPAGRGLTRIISNSQRHVQVITAREKRSYPNIEDAIVSEIGWPFPVNQAKFWVTGRPDPARWHREDSNTRKSRGIYHWIQEDWRVEVQDILILKQGHIAPKKIRFSYPALASKPDIILQLVVKKWQPHFQ